MFITLLCTFLALQSDGKDSKKTPWTLKEGMTWTGSYKSVEVDKNGNQKKPQNYTFTLTIETVKGDQFIGKWNWSERVITQVEGRFAKNGELYMKFTKNLKGNSPSAFDGEAKGWVNDKAISMKYVLPSGNRVGLIEGEFKKETTKADSKAEQKKPDESSKAPSKDKHP